MNPSTAVIPSSVVTAQNHVHGLLMSSGAGDAPFIIVDASDQRLYLFERNQLKFEFPVSTSAVGVGSAEGSNRTPLGLHRIAEKFGDGEPIGMIFKARQPTGKLAAIQTKPIKGDGDDVTTRIMWLQGMQPGVNEGKGVDSHARYIYIHGTPEEGLIGRPESHGCIRMNNTQVIELFNQVPVGTLVDIIK
ncbi:MAG: L,D-transpeptidase family protein [Halothiobacillus sp.]